MSIFGRREEQRELQRFVESPRSEFVVVTGRRRVGKTYLVREYFNNEFAFYATGIAGGSMRDQLDAFNAMLARCGMPGKASSWIAAFEQLRELLERDDVRRDAVGGKIVVFIDEMPWLDTARSRFLQALEFFWNSWASARKDVLLIACGSETSWVVRNLFENHGGLHNRVTGRIHLGPFTLGECRELYRMNGMALGDLEALEAYMVFGGIPYYIEAMDRRLGLPQNIDRLCFSRGGQLADEFDQLFRSLFKHAEKHIEVVRALARHPEGLTRAELVEELKDSDGGMLTKALSDLVHCDFLRKYRDFTKESREGVYQLIDPFTLFWLRFVEHADDEHWWSANMAGGAARAWRGQAFELVCLLHVRQILASLGIWGVSTSQCSWRSSKTNPAAQIDLVIDRADGIVDLCEMKFSREPYVIEKDYEAKLVHKAEAFVAETGTGKSVQLLLVSPRGLKRNIHSGVVQSVVTIDDLLD